MLPVVQVIFQSFLEATNNKSKVHSVDPNRKMISIGKKKLGKYKNISWKVANAENYPSMTLFLITM